MERTAVPMAVSTSVARTPPCTVPAGFRCSSVASIASRALPSVTSPATTPSRPANPPGPVSSLIGAPYPARAPDHANAGDAPPACAFAGGDGGGTSLCGAVDPREARSTCQWSGPSRPGGPAPFPDTRGRPAMRFMVIGKATEDTEKGVLPTEQELAEMGAYSEELVRAGILLSGAGLLPSSTGARVRFDKDGGSTVIDGPFAETKELIAGFTLLEVSSREEAIEWVRRAPIRDGEAEI